MRSRLRSLSTRRKATLGAAFLLVLLAGAAVLFAQPSVSGVDNRFGDVNETTTVVESDLQIRNPNPVGASLGGLTVDYAIDMNGIRMARGTKTGVSLPQGRSSTPMTTSIANERIPSWWVSHVRNGERTELAVNADVHSATLGTSFGAPKVTRTVETDVISAFNATEDRPVGSSPTGGPLIVVKETSAQWGAVDAAETRIEMRFVVHNPTSFPVPFSELGYRATMNGVAMGNGSTEGAGVIPPGETRTIRATTVLYNEHLDEWWVTHLQNDQVTDLRIDFSARFELPTRTVEIPLDPLTYTRTIETDVFDTRPDDGPTAADNGTATPAGPSTATPIGEDGADGTPTATPTDDGGEGTATATPTATPTDDDGLLGGDDGTPTPTPTDGGNGGLLRLYPSSVTAAVTP
jgi:LEA14-like dessication related protein